MSCRQHGERSTSASAHLTGGKSRELNSGCRLPAIRDHAFWNAHRFRIPSPRRLSSSPTSPRPRACDISTLMAMPTARVKQHGRNRRRQRISVLDASISLYPTRQYNKNSLIIPGQIVPNRYFCCSHNDNAVGNGGTHANWHLNQSI